MSEYAVFNIFHIFTRALFRTLVRTLNNSRDAKVFRLKFMKDFIEST